ncbi:NAD(P)H-binding protein [Actinoallomurus sp. NPDC052308]|uniref:NAD(P)H-binding protein n=1 Tax=Actinoallomurus sp. NPDC052308 TaxID=3155530 RepID=UPI003418553E
MIVITTPTGQIGRQVVDNVLDRGESIRVIARDPSRLSPGVRERAEVVPGSHDRLDVITEALDGADAVFWLVPPDPRADSVEGHILGFTRPFCEAIEKQGVQRVVGVSTLGRGVAENAGQISAALAMDELIERTGVGYRALQMPGFMENLLQQVGAIRSQGAFYLALSGDHKNPTCATRDIAAVAAELLLDGSWSGQEGVPVLGPEDLSPNDMARIMSEVLGRPIRFQQVSGAAYKATLVRNGLSEPWAQGLADMTAAIDRGLYNARPHTPRSTTPTGFRQWCEEVLKPAVEQSGS